VYGLVYKFLNENHLPEDEFYDVVVFAYLKAVKDYFNSPSAQKFSPFAAWILCRPARGEEGPFPTAA